jgi:transposase
MAAPAKIDPELLKYAVSDKERLYLQQCLDSVSMRAAAKELNVNDGTIRQAVERVRARAAKMGYAPEHDLNKPTTAPFVVKGTSTLYGEDGQPKLQWVKTNLDREAQIEIMKQAVEAICEDVKPVKAIPAPLDVNDQLISIYPWGDPHVGMYAWADEVGDDFDLKIAEQDMCNAVDYLVERSPPSKRGVLVNLGDFFHYTNMTGTTERSGHVLDRDSRTAKMIDVGVRIIRRCLERMREKHEIVELINAPGNHDETFAHFLNVLFRNLYANEHRVIVHDAPTTRHYLQHGKCLIGVVHGHQTKDRDLPGIMATEKPEEWGATRHRVFFRGHHHHDNRVEYNGCIVEQMRTLARDAYAVGGGYLSGRDMKCIVMHSEFGEQMRLTCGIDVLRSTYDE